MKRFCPTCDAIVETPSEQDRRCPRCHHAIEASLSEEPAAPSRRPKAILALAVLVLIAAAGIGFWQLRLQATPGGSAGSAPGAVAPSTDLAKKLAQAGLKGDAAVLPGTADAALTQAGSAAKDLAGVATLLDGLKSSSKLQLVSASTRRKHPVENTATLWGQIQAGKAQPLHSIEVAFLAQALLQATGAQTELVTEGDGLQTPLLLSRTRLGVRKVGEQRIIEPLGAAPMKTPRVVAPAQAVAWWLVLRANSHRIRSEFPQVYLDLGAAASVQPDEPAAAFARGVADIDQGLPDKGVPACEAALVRSDDAMARLFLAEVAQALEQPVKALQRAEEVLRTHPDLPEALVAKAVLELGRVATVPEAQKAGLVADAKTLLDKAVSLDASVAGAQAALAQTALLQKDEAGADKILQDAAAKGDLDAALMLSEVRRKKGDNAGAVAALQAAPERIEDERFVLGMLTALMANKEADKAMDLAERAYKLSPGNPQIGLMRADLLRMSGKLPEAIAALEPLKQGADGEKIGLLQAQLLLQNREPQKATPMLEAAVAKKPDSHDATLLLIMAYAMTQRMDKVEALGKTATAQKVIKPMDLAGVYLQAGDAEHAAQVLQAVVQETPGDSEALGTLAMLYTASGRKKDAEALRDKVAAAAGAQGAEVRDLVDKAIAAAEAELARAKEGAPAAPKGE